MYILIANLLFLFFLFLIMFSISIVIVLYFNIQNFWLSIGLSFSILLDLLTFKQLKIKYRRIEISNMLNEESLYIIKHKEKDVMTHFKLKSKKQYLELQKKAFEVHNQFENGQLIITKKAAIDDLKANMMYSTISYLFFTIYVFSDVRAIFAMQQLAEHKINSIFTETKRYYFDIGSFFAKFNLSEKKYTSISLKNFEF